jgi:hypothetical protein
MEALPTAILSLVMRYLYFEHATICRVSRRFRATYMRDKGHLWPYTSKYLVAPFSLFQWIYRENRCPIDVGTFARVARGAEYQTALPWLRARSNQWDKDTVDAVLERGDLTMLAWLRSLGCPWDEWSLRKAARDGHLLILQWAHNIRDPVAIRALGAPQILYGAAARGHFAVVLWLAEIGTPVSDSVATFAAKHGHWDIVIWLHSHNFPYHSEYILIHAAAQARTRILLWALGAFEALPRDNRAIVGALARRGGVDVIQWLIRQGFNYEEKDLLYQATLNGNFPVMIWVIDELGCALEARVFEAAATHGNLATLEWLKARNCPFNSKVGVAAARRANYEAVRWLRAQLGIELSPEMATAAASEGHLAFLQWLVAEGCPLDVKTRRMAVLRRQTAVVHWLS